MHKCKKNSPSTPAQVFFNLLLDNIEPKEAWERAGCDFEVQSKEYNAITQRARRLKVKALAKAVRINEAKQKIPSPHQRKSFLIYY